MNNLHCRHDCQHSAAGGGSRGSTFCSGGRAPLLRPQRSTRREPHQQACSATALQPQRRPQQAEAQLLSAAASTASVLQPPQPTGIVPDEKRDQRLRDRDAR